ncbi:unnamed protein product [Cylicocyclus nassatus]|uniref:Saposin B-type domain-containing protein n=1 Tax=Cylicocyclus nassatus TaxID=53992 RepID=A0AA36DUJ5_CYLNA|nr:unnamed protein product [Cylicocyclus nassatus]
MLSLYKGGLPSLLSPILLIFRHVITYLKYVFGNLVGYLKGKLEGGVDDVQKIATQFCGEKAPILLQGACKSFVEDSMSRIVALLKEKVDVTKICTIIKMCKN